MRYDPFASPDGDPAETGTTPRRTAAREPRILIDPLTPFEWKTPVPARKRPRSATPSSAPMIRSAPAPSTANGDRVVEKVVEKIVTVEKVVEKIVTVPADEQPTIMGLPPLVDDRVRNVVNFILQHVNEPGVEVEAKFGTLLRKFEGDRACKQLPVLCETPLDPHECAGAVRFESSVHHCFFRHLNSELNRRVEATAGSENPAGRVSYQRTRELDLFWPGRIRETRRVAHDAQSDQETFETVRVQRKTRLGDLNCICPLGTVDVRYSASKEEDAGPLPAGETDPAKRRYKERISYRFDGLSVDITSVETTDPQANLFNHTTHEIEVEIADSANLFDEVVKYRNGDPTSQIFRIATTLVNTIRILLEEFNKVAAAEEQQHVEQQQMGGNQMEVQSGSQGPGQSQGHAQFATSMSGNYERERAPSETGQASEQQSQRSGRYG